MFQKLEELGLVTFTPARTGRGDRKCKTKLNGNPATGAEPAPSPHKPRLAWEQVLVTLDRILDIEGGAFINYDDLYVTTLAARHGGCVLSGDKFKDILAQSTYSEFHHVILHRTLDIKFRFLPHEIVHHGADVFYKALPELFIYEDVSVRAKVIAQKIFASPEDPEYSKVLLRRETWNEDRRNERIGAIDDMLAELCERHAIRPLALENLPGYQLQMEALEDVEDKFGTLFEEEQSFGDTTSNHNLIVDELWIDTSTSSSNSEACPLIDFSYCSSPLRSFPRMNSFEDLVLPLQEDYMGSSGQEEKTAPASDYGIVDIREIKDYKQLEVKPLTTAYSQEDVLREIVAHIDTLITTRDKLSKRETSMEAQITLDEFSIFRDHSEEKAMKTSHAESPLSAKTPIKLIEGIDEESSTSACDRLSVSASSEEEISYTNNHSNGDISCHIVADESKIESTLSAIFPVHIVQQVLTLNASRNVAFLANQCAELCS